MALEQAAALTISAQLEAAAGAPAAAQAPTDVDSPQVMGLMARLAKVNRAGWIRCVWSTQHHF
jgi:hypothetical protein